MKNYIYLIIIFFITSCSSFLKETSQDLIKPNKVSHYKETLQGEGYFMKLMSRGWFIEAMTDNLELFTSTVNGVETTSSAVEYSENCFTWQSDIEEKLGDDNLYIHLYNNILAANICLENVYEAEGENWEKYQLLGQASFTRAYGYFVLANLYAQAYNEADKNDLCVPLNLETTPSLKKFDRATIEEIWTLIKEDSENAVEYLKDIKVSMSVFEINYPATLLFAARVALFMENWDDVIKYGELFLKDNSSLFDIPAEMGNGKSSSNRFLDRNINPEIVFSFGDDNYHQEYQEDYNNITLYSYRTSESNENSLIISYIEDDEIVDLRKYMFFEEPDLSWAAWYPEFAKERYLYNKYNTNYSSRKTNRRECFRTAEIYLMLAEANIRKVNPDYGKAEEYLKTLRDKRIRNNYLYPLNFSTQQEWINFIFDERRRELCFEEFHRWWDLRRMGQPRIEHKWKDQKIFVLEEKDPAYILNIPKAERDFNPNMKGNNRPERVAQNN